MFLCSNKYYYFLKKKEKVSGPHQHEKQLKILEIKDFILYKAV